VCLCVCVWMGHHKRSCAVTAMPVKLPAAAAAPLLSLCASACHFSNTLTICIRLHSLHLLLIKHPAHHSLYHHPTLIRPELWLHGALPRDPHALRASVRQSGVHLLPAARGAWRTPLPKPAWLSSRQQWRTRCVVERDVPLTVLHTPCPAVCVEQL
jgi:hypothetical protein